VSQENVEVVRRGAAAWQRDDLNAWLATIDPSVEWHTVLERLVEGGESFYRGHEGMRKLWRSYRTELEDFQLNVEELQDLGDDRVLLLGHFSWRGLASGIESKSMLGMVITVQDGKVTQSIDYLSHSDALKAVGLEE
jgi:ketosteroid isomerase-like protein